MPTRDDAVVGASSAVKWRVPTLRPTPDATTSEVATNSRRRRRRMALVNRCDSLGDDADGDLVDGDDAATRSLAARILGLLLRSGDRDALAALGGSGDRDALAALGATATKHLAATTGLLTGAEAVGALAAFIVRLICTLGHDEVSG